MKKFILLIFLIFPIFGFCFSWQSLWFTPNQQGINLLKQNKPATAAKKFENPIWRGYANYKSEQYQQAMQDFSKENTALANFNRGNALVQLGQYQTAIDAYNSAIKQQSNFSDAIYNKNLVEQFLKQQTQQQQNTPQDQQQPKTDQNKQNPSTSPTSSSTSPSTSKAQQNSNSQQQNINSQAENSSDNSFKSNQENSSPQTNSLTSEQQQTLNRWMQQIPDNPGGLLKQKFLRDHLRLQTEQTNS